MVVLVTLASLLPLDFKEPVLSPRLFNALSLLRSDDSGRCFFDNVIPAAFQYQED
jgi:hypothetical protein